MDSVLSSASKSSTVSAFITPSLASTETYAASDDEQFTDDLSLQELRKDNGAVGIPPSAAGTEALASQEANLATPFPPKPDKEDVIWVEFDEAENARELGDRGNPLLWPKWYKWLSTILLTISGFNASLEGGSLAISLDSMQAELGCSAEVARLALSVYPLGFACAPLILSPTSEEFGRLPVNLCSVWFFTAMLFPIAFGPNVGAVIAGRFLSACGASTATSMVFGCLSDMFTTSERGKAIGLVSFASFAGLTLAPMVFGVVAQRLGWRWVQYIMIMWNGFVGIMMTLVLSESRTTVILRKRAKRLRAKTGDQRYRARSEGTVNLSHLLHVSLSRPLWYLISEPVVTAFSLWVAFAWAVLWALLEAVPYSMSYYYHFDTTAQGLAFTGAFVGTMAGYALNIFQERIYKRKFPEKGPEARLYSATVGGLCLPLGMIWFAWSTGRTTWVVPQCALALVMFGVYAIYVGVSNYLADAYLYFAASALAAQSLLRNIWGFAFPLFMIQCLRSLGVAWGVSLFSFLGFILAVIPLVLFTRGPEIRAKSKACQELQRDLRE